MLPTFKEGPFKDSVKELFIEACQKNELEKVKACITLGVDINLVTDDGKWSGLTAAAHNGSLETLDHLLTLPTIDVNIKTTGSDTYGKVTAFHQACRSGKLDVVKKLMNVPNIELNKDKDGWNEAIWASDTANFTQVLMSNPLINWNNKTNIGETPLLRAVPNGHEVVGLIISIPGIDFNAKLNNGETLAQIAVA